MDNFTKAVKRLIMDVSVASTAENMRQSKATKMVNSASDNLQAAHRQDVVAALSRVDKRCDVCAGDRQVMMSGTGIDGPAEYEPCEEEVHEYVDAEMEASLKAEAEEL